jgi:ClpP class serine protease
MKEEIDKLLKKVQEVTKENKMDLSSDEDLSVAVMNLVSIEEHLFFTGAKTKKSNYFDLLNKVREMRKELLKKIVKDAEGEVWCISKHLLAASMRLMEVGTKELNKGNKKEAEDFFSKAYDLYSLFWGINLKLVDIGEVKKVGESQLNVHDKENSLFSKLGDIVQKIVDCCKE